MDIHISVALKEYKKVIKKINLNKYNDGDIIFKIKEYYNCLISFDYEVDKYNVYVDTYKIAEQKVSTNEFFELNVMESEYRFIPGYYTITVEDGDMRTIYYFEVIPQNVSWNQMFKIRNYISNFLQGIIFNYDIKRKVDGNTLENDIFQDYKKQYEIWQDIQGDMYSILRNPSNKLDKIYEYSSKLIKFNSKVFRKNNIVSTESNKYYQPVTKITYDNSDNIKLYLALGEYYERVKKIYNNLEKHMSLLCNKNDDFNISLNNKEKEYCNIKDNYVFSQRYKDSVFSRMQFIKNQIFINNKKIEKVKQIEKILYTMKNEVEDMILNFSQLINFENVNKFLNNSIKDMRYKNIIDKLYIPIYKIDEDNRNNNEYGFTFKKSELLFEYYCFLQVLNIISLLDFDCSGGWLNEVAISRYEMDIPSECETYFIKGNLELRVSYDKEIPERIYNGYKGMYSSNSKCRRPDILILLYENGVFKKALICEVKYRNIKYIYNDYGDTEVVATMKDYYQLCYFDNNINKDAVSKVLLLYPHHSKVIDYSNFILKDCLNFLAMEISDGIASNLFEEISDFIEKNSNLH